MGEVPIEVCNRHNEGNLAQISTDCKADSTFKIKCSCCFNCPLSKESSSFVCQEDSSKSFGAYGVANIEDQQRINDIKSKCIELSGENAICHHNTPQYLAMNWLIDDDTWMLEDSSPDFIQRYVIAVLYFSLGPIGWVDSFWLSPKQDECLIIGVECNYESKKITALNFRESWQSRIFP